MGLFKKFAEKMQAGLPDYEAEVRSMMQPGEDLLGIGFASHAAPEMDTAVGPGSRNIIGAAINATAEARKKGQHLSGADDSCAMAIPRDGQYLTVAISDQRLSFWSFGMSAREIPPSEVLAFPRSSVASVAATGQTDNYGAMTRFSFTDESFADMKILDQPTYAAFRAAADGLST
jgi:hypothetical protein